MTYFLIFAIVLFMDKKLIVLVGPPGSGKSTLAKEYAKLNYTYVNQDTQGKDHIHTFDIAVMDGKCVVVDRMNFDKRQRGRYLQVAKENGYHTTIIVLHQPRKICYERAVARTDHPTIKDGSSANSALNTFFSKYERPTSDEADVVEFRYPDIAKDVAIVCDLDGTLCNVDHRLHHVRTEEGVKKNWKAFFDNLMDDKPNQWCAEIVDKFSTSLQIVYASGRPDDHRRKTEEWLKENNLDFHGSHLYMRCRGDHRQDYVAKEIILDFEILTRFKPLFFIDDRQQVVDLWRSRGFVCLACAKGDF